MALDSALKADLVALSRAIHADPELAYHEYHAAERICALLERYGHTVERGTGGLETAFRSRIGPASGPCVALLAEYDALPDVGHGCGHNLLAMTNVGAYLLAGREAERLEVAIDLIGTPAEESSGGKIDMLERGVFDDCVAVLSTHPAPDRWSVGERLLGVQNFRVGFHGLAAHAAAAPERGKNALSAAIRLFVGLDGWREQLPADARVHGIITRGGDAPNIIPSYAEAIIGLRSADARRLEAMIEQFMRIAEGAALQTGTRVEISEYTRLHYPKKPDPALTDVLAEELTKRGVAFQRGELAMASSDLGNVSQVKPTSTISFPVSTERIPGHSHQMTEASRSDLAHENAALTCEMLGAAALRVATDETTRKRRLKSQYGPLRSSE